MWSCLLLALALLGTVPTSCSNPVSPNTEEMETETEMEMETAGVAIPEEDGGASDIKVPCAPNETGTSTCTYVVVATCRTFRQAQRYCARRYRGKLASIHSAGTNSFLLHLAQRVRNAGLVWIGAVSQPAFPRPRCSWTDRSRWNYSQWVPGHPRRGRCFCTGLCTNNGLWRSVNCRRRLPFICEI